MIRAFAALGLLGCLLVPTLYFRGSLDEPSMKLAFLASSIVWFAAAGWTSARRG